MSPEIPFSSLPQSIQESRIGEETSKTLSRKLWEDCVGFLEQHGHNGDLNHSLIQKFKDSSTRELKFSESSTIRFISNSIKVKDSDDLEVTIFSFGVVPGDSPYIVMSVRDLDLRNFLVISGTNKNKRAEFWHMFSLDYVKEATGKDLVEYSQVINLLKKNPPKQEES